MYDSLFTITCGRCKQNSPLENWCDTGIVTLPRGHYQCPRCRYAFKRQAQPDRKRWEPFIKLQEIDANL